MGSDGKETVKAVGPFCLVSREVKGPGREIEKTCDGLTDSRERHS